MSRLFNGSTDVLSIDTAAATAVPITLACWFYPADVTTPHSLLGLVDKDSTERFLLYAAGDVAGDPVRAQTVAAAGTSIASTTTSFVANAWQHAAVVFASANNRSAYLNGGGKATNGASRTPAGIDRTCIGRAEVASPVSPATGRIAEAAAWTVALSDADVALLAGGRSPLRVQPGSLVGYWPLSGFQSPEEDFGGALDLTVTGAVAAEHPPVDASPVTAKPLATVGA